MAYYTDYTNNVTWDTSYARTMSYVCNTIADRLVSTAGCTLNVHASTSADSSSSNYAEVVYYGLYIRFYSSGGYLHTDISYSAGGAAISSTNKSLPYSSYITVNIRFYNTKSGFMAFIYLDTGVWSYWLFGGAMTRVSTGATSYCVSATNLYNACSNAYVGDGLSNTYYIPALVQMGPKDADGIRQVITNAFLSTSSSYPYARYIFSDVYMSYAWLYTGIVQIGSRYFFIDTCGSNVCVAIELNA